MKTIWIEYKHCSGRKTLQPFSYYTEAEIEDYKQWLIESGEAIEIYN